MNISKPDFLKEIRLSLEYLERSSRLLGEEDSNFAPTEEQMTVAQQLAHIGQTVTWYLDGAFSASGFDLDFEKHAREIAAYTSVESAREYLRKSFAKAIEKIESTPDEEWDAPIVPGPVMGGEPRSTVLFGIIEHTAHHRGALTVYTRLRNKQPPMPYMETA